MKFSGTVEWYDIARGYGYYSSDNDKDNNYKASVENNKVTQNANGKDETAIKDLNDYIK